MDQNKFTQYYVHVYVHLRFLKLTQRSDEHKSKFKPNEKLIETSINLYIQTLNTIFLCFTNLQRSF